MRFSRPLLTVAFILLLIPAGARAVTVREEHCTGGVLDLVWQPGFGLPFNLQPGTLAPADPGYANPSGDHTVGLATTGTLAEGGLVLSATDPLGYANYTWEAQVFTGDGNSRRGLVLRADPNNQFSNNYNFTLRSGLLSIDFRKLVGQTPSTLGTWITATLPGGVPATNTWHSMKVIASGNGFRCFFDGIELTASPIVDGDFATGWVGIYNFSATTPSVTAMFDDLILTADTTTPAAATTWGSLKARYAK
jgi:hypothetical protein